MTPEEFAATVKAKYPQYDSIPDVELAQKIVEKHPEYAGMVQFNRVAVDAGEALLTNLPTEGFKQDLVRGLPAMAGAIPGAAAGAAMGLPFGPPGVAVGGIAGAALGGGAGEALRQAASQATAMAFPKENYPVASTGQIARDVATEGFLQGAFQSIGPVVGATGRAVAPRLARVAAPVAKYVAENVAGITKPAYAFAKENLPAVSKMVGASVDVANNLGDTLKQTLGDYLQSLRPNPQEANAMVESFKSGVARVAKQLKDEYPAQLDAIAQNPKYAVKTVKLPNGRIVNEGKSFNLFTRLRNDVFKIAREHGYDEPSLTGGMPDAAIFNKFTEKIVGLKKATADQVVVYLRVANDLADKHVGTPLGAALGKFADAVRNTAAKSIPEIAKANASYAAGKELEELASGAIKTNNLVEYVGNVYKSGLNTEKKVALDAVKAAAPEVVSSIEGIQNYIAKNALADAEEKSLKSLTNANDIISKIKSIYSPEGNTRDKVMLENLAKKVPEVGKLIKEIRTYNTGKEFSPGLRGLPDTGLKGALLLGGAEAIRDREAIARHPVPAALLGAAALAFSPRASLLALRGIKAVTSPAFGKMAAAQAPSMAQTAVPASAALAALAVARRKQKEK